MMTFDSCPYLSLSYTKLRLSTCLDRLVEEYSGTDTYAEPVRNAMEYGKKIHERFKDDNIILELFPHARKIEFEKELRVAHKSGITLHGFIDCVVEDDKGTYVLELKTGYVREYSREQLAFYISLLALTNSLDPLTVKGSFVLYSPLKCFWLLPVDIEPLDIDAAVEDYIKKTGLKECICLK